MNASSGFTSSKSSLLAGEYIIYYIRSIEEEVEGEELYQVQVLGNSQIFRIDIIKHDSPLQETPMHNVG